jgi:hypothetical protein
MSTLIIGSGKVCSDLPCVSLRRVFSRERMASETDMQAERSGHEPVSCGACCGISVKVVRFGALAS